MFRLFLTEIDNLQAHVRDASSSLFHKPASSFTPRTALIQEYKRLEQGLNLFRNGFQVLVITRPYLISKWNYTSSRALTKTILTGGRLTVVVHVLFKIFGCLDLSIHLARHRYSFLGGRTNTLLKPVFSTCSLSFLERPALSMISLATAITSLVFG